MRMIGMLRVALPLLLLNGCVVASPLAQLRNNEHLETSFIPTRNIDATPRDENCHLDVVLDRSPERPYIVVGRATAIWTGIDRAAVTAAEDEVIPTLYNRACSAGGHVVFRVSSHFQDQWIHSPASQTGTRDFMVRTIRATALVGVYVARDGSALAPPSGPRRIIRVPAVMEEGARSEDPDEGLTWDQGIENPWAVPAP